MFLRVSSSEARLAVAKISEFQVVLRLGNLIGGRGSVDGVDLAHGKRLLAGSVG